MADVLDGYVMPPTPVLGDEIASVICGHDFIQELTEEEHAYFEHFVRSVLEAYGVPVSRVKDTDVAQLNTDRAPAADEVTGDAGSNPVVGASD